MYSFGVVDGERHDRFRKLSISLRRAAGGEHDLLDYFDAAPSVQDPLSDNIYLNRTQDKF